MFATSGDSDHICQPINTHCGTLKISKRELKA
jgi:hypothetical protein